jgi:hypothetical protein
MSRAAHLSYRRLTDLSLRRERLRNRGAVAPIDRRPQSMRPDDTRAFAMKSPVDAHDANAAKSTVAAEVAVTASRVAFVLPTGRPRSVASSRRHTGDR